MKINIKGFFQSLFKGKNKKQAATMSVSRPVEFIQFRLEQFMHEKKPYLQPGYTIKHLADDLGIPAYQLSAVINQHIGVHFSDYLNQHRIRYCEEMILREAGKILSLHDLAEQCGFQNRNTFTAAFKKFTGYTPSDYTKHFLS
ncbi:MAG: helix-turn-helix domain-containing protein [Chitinophagaceae bacterium]